MKVTVTYQLRECFAKWRQSTTVNEARGRQNRITFQNPSNCKRGKIKQKTSQEKRPGSARLNSSLASAVIRHTAFYTAHQRLSKSFTNTLLVIQSNLTPFSGHRLLTSCCTVPLVTWISAFLTKTWSSVVKSIRGLVRIALRHM